MDSDVPQPCTFIREALAANNWTQEDLAAILDKSKSTVGRLVRGQTAITAETAHMLAAAFGGDADLWIQRENAWQLSLLPTADISARASRERELIRARNCITEAAIAWKFGRGTDPTGRLCTAVDRYLAAKDASAT